MTSSPQIQEHKENGQLVPPLEESERFMKERTEVLLRLFQDYNLRACHYESQRATVGNVIVIGTVGLIGLVGEIGHNDWPLAVAIALMGLFGGRFTASYVRRIQSSHAKAKRHRKALDRLLFKGRKDTLASLAKAIDKKPVSERQKWWGIRIAMYWPLVTTLIALGFLAYMWSLPPTEKTEYTIHYVGPK